MTKTPDSKWSTDQAYFMDICGQKRFTLAESLQAMTDRRQDWLSQVAMYMSLIEEEGQHELRVVWYNRIASPIPPGVLSHDDAVDENINTLVDMADGAIDTIYVVLGLLNTIGIPAGEVWDIVQRTNVDKAIVCMNCGGSGKENGAEECTECNGTGRKIKRRADGKILKPEGWKEPTEAIRRLILDTINSSAKNRVQQTQSGDSQTDATGSGSISGG